jgi:Recombination endonuclease VII
MSTAKTPEQKARRAEYYRHWNRENPEARRTHVLRTRYGITAEEYDAMLEAQNGVCAICQRECRTGMRLAVDHERETGKVRGLLCRACNGGIGAMQYSVENLERAATYLRSAKL